MIDKAVAVVGAHRKTLGSTGMDAKVNGDAKRKAIRELAVAVDIAKANDRRDLVSLQVGGAK